MGVGQHPRPPHRERTVFTGSHSHGQGHETTFAQVVADKLGISVDHLLEASEGDVEFKAGMLEGSCAGDLAG